MLFEGVLRKMRTEFDDPIQYFLEFESDFLHMNPLLGKTLHLNFVKTQCLNCGNDRPIYRQGFCRSCFFDSPATGDWIMRPELSTAHLDQADRDLDYEKRAQLQPHIVYLANSSNVKVGVTRKSQIPTRWIDQGAHEAIEIVEVPNRYLAGITEVALKAHVADKTNWRKMVTNTIEDADLKAWREKLREFIPEETQSYFLADRDETQLHFPAQAYAPKIKSLNLEKAGNYQGVLQGIKGQYLLFEDGHVFNVRANEGLYIGMDIR